MEAVGVVGLGLGGAALVFGQLGRDKRDDQRIGPVLLKKTGLGGGGG